MAFQKINLRQLLDEKISKIGTGNTSKTTDIETGQPDYKTKYNNLDPSIPEGYQFAKDAYSSYPTPTTKFSELSEHIGGGEYAHDPNNGDLLVKSQRVFNRNDNRILRKGKPSHLYEVDHIVPLWLGGTDSDKNKEVLLKKDHNIKTKQNSVIMELYYNNKISLPEAKVLALNWKDKNVDDIVLDDKGRIDAIDPLNLAESKLVEWAQPKKVTLKDWWSSFKEGFDFGDSPLAQFSEGLGSGLTMDWLPAQKEEYDNARDQLIGDVSQMAGKAVGTMGNFILLGGVVRAAAAALKIPSLVETRATKGLFKIAKPIFRGGRIAVSKNTAAMALQNAGLFTLHGQLSKQEQNDFEGRVKRFLSDAAFGGLLSVPDQTLKSYVGLATGVYALSALEGADPSEAFTNTAIVVGLHGIGRINYNNRLEQSANDAAIEVRASFGLTTKPKTTGGWTKEELAKGYETAKDRIRAKAETPEQAASDIYKLMISNKQLYKGGLATAMSLREEFADLISVSNTVTQKNVSNFGKMPKEKISAIAEYNKASGKVAIDDAILTQKPIGRVSMTGIGENVSKQNYKNIQEFSKKNSGDVYLITRDEPTFVDFIKSKGKYQSPEKNVQIVDVVDGKVKSLGMWPSVKKIGEINITRSAWQLPQSDIRMDKNAIYDAMKRSNTQVVKVDVKSVGISKNGLPYLDVELTKNNWAESISKAKSGITKMEPKKPSITLAQRPTAAKERPIVSGTETVDTITSGQFTHPHKYLFADMIHDVQKVLEIKNPNNIVKHFGKLGINLTREQASAISSNANKVKVSHVVQLIEDNYQLGRLNDTGKSFYNMYIDNPDSFYKSLSTEQKNLVNSLNVISKSTVPEKATINKAKTGKIKQEIPIAQEQPVKKAPIVAKEQPIKKAPIVAKEQPIKKAPVITPKQPVKVQTQQAIQPKQPAKKVVVEDVTLRGKKESPVLVKQPQVDSTRTKSIYTTPAEKEYEKLKNEIKRLVDDYDTIGNESSEQIAKKLSGQISAIINKRARQLNSGDKNRLTEQLSSYAEDRSKQFSTSEKEATVVGRDALEDELLGAQIEKEGTEVLKKIGSEKAKTTTQDLYEAFASAAKNSSTNTKFFWNKLKDKLKDVTGKNIKDTEIDTYKLSKLFEENYSLTKDLRDIGVNIQLNKFDKLPANVKTKVNEVIKKYPNARIYFAPTSQPNKYPEISYNLFGDVVTIYKLPEFKKMLLDNGIKKITAEELPLIKKYLATGNKDWLPTKYAEILEEQFLSSSTIGLSDASIVNDAMGRSHRVSDRALFADSKSSKVATQRDIDEPFEFSAMSWSMEPLKDINFTKTDLKAKNIKRIVNNIMPLLRSTFKDAGISRAESLKTKTTDKQTNDLIMDLLNKKR